MNTCKSCRFWRLSFFGSLGACGRVDDYKTPAGKRFDIYFQSDGDSDGEVIELRTGPDFGCVLHEEKSEEKS